MTLWNKVVHQLYDFSRLIGLRDRLRCPECKAMGTYKPHGGWLDFEDKRKERRWMCKWCGAYSGPETNMTFAFPNMLTGCWTNANQVGTVLPPLNQHLDHYRGQVAWADTFPDRTPPKVDILDSWTPWPWEG